jgi:hypothetical protein
MKNNLQTVNEELSRVFGLRNLDIGEEDTQPGLVVDRLDDVDDDAPTLVMSRSAVIALREQPAALPPVDPWIAALAAAKAAR